MARVHGAEMKRRSSHELSGLDCAIANWQNASKKIGAMQSRIMVSSFEFCAG